MINLSFSDVFDLINRFLQWFVCTVNFSFLTSGLSLFSISLISIVLFILMFFVCGMVYTFYRYTHFCIYAYAYRRCAISDCEKDSPLRRFSRNLASFWQNSVAFIIYLSLLILVEKIDCSHSSIHDAFLRNQGEVQVGTGRTAVNDSPSYFIHACLVNFEYTLYYLADLYLGSS